MYKKLENKLNKIIQMFRKLLSVLLKHVFMKNQRIENKLKKFKKYSSNIKVCNH